jgi:hypothetical protein
MPPQKPSNLETYNAMRKPLIDESSRQQLESNERYERVDQVKGALLGVFDAMDAVGKTETDSIMTGFYAEANNVAGFEVVPMELAISAKRFIDDEYGRIGEISGKWVIHSKFPDEAYQGPEEMRALDEALAPEELDKEYEGLEVGDPIGVITISHETPSDDTGGIRNFFGQLFGSKATAAISPKPIPTDAKDIKLIFHPPRGSGYLGSYSDAEVAHDTTDSYTPITLSELEQYVGLLSEWGRAARKGLGRQQQDADNQIRLSGENLIKAFRTDFGVTTVNHHS